MEMKKAVIDIGTNSIKYTLAEGSETGFSVLTDVSKVTKLGEGLADTGLIGAEPLERTAQGVAEYVKQAQSAGAWQIEIVGTMALRTANNTRDFMMRVRELTGVGMRVIPGEEEARLSFAAVLAGIPEASHTDMLMFDTGGGSTEFVFAYSGQMTRSFSINVGAIRFTEKFLTPSPVSSGALSRAHSAIMSELAEGGVGRGAKLLVGTGGNVTAMAAVKLGAPGYDSAPVQGVRLTHDDVTAQINSYASKTIEERRAIPGLNPKRADIILAGACISSTVMELSGIDAFTVSDRGLRHGLLADMFRK